MNNSGENKMKIIAISGSRNPEGKTGMAVEAFCKGVEVKKAQIEKVFLAEKNIERCRQCNASGWGICRTEGRCTIEYESFSIVDKIRQADGVLFATPVYFSDISESMKAFLDRMRRITRNENGLIGISEKPAIGICVAGGGGGGSVMCCFFLERIISGCTFTVIDMIPCRRQNLALKQKILSITGEWFVEQILTGDYKK
jgi:multimeric flavodoxin WrbA